MFDAQLNFYSILIPITIICLGIAIACLYIFQRLPRYLASYSLALVCVGFSLLLQTVLTEDFLEIVLGPLFAIYFLGCALHIYAIHERLHLPARWPVLISLIFLGSIAIFYFSAIEHQQVYSLLVTSFTTAAIFLHRPIALWQHRAKLKIDRALKVLILVVVFFIIMRAVLFSFLMQGDDPLSSYDGLWAFTQLLRLLVDIIFLSLFFNGAFQEVVVRLSQERNYDPLTGLLNRRALEQYLTKIKNQPSTQKAVLIADLDHFKQVNDQYGHTFGDLALQHVSQIFQQNIRSSDKVIRMGGEEFLILLDQCPHAKALQIAERIRSSVENMPLQYRGQCIHLTISVGVSFFKQSDEFEHAYNQADELLYQAKNQGRNRVHFQPNLA
ncbi:GGDEF domain-containing protein [Acinetobacter thermotolerans]|uniref:GGDEF domain-containing protein n=1 Tax=Acinetobacter thermotolerans TaxID=3151487 RepID=UPI00325B65B9